MPNFGVMGVIASVYAYDPAGFPRSVEAYFSLFSEPFRNRYHRVRDESQLLV